MPAATTATSLAIFKIHVSIRLINNRIDFIHASNSQAMSSIYFHQLIQSAHIDVWLFTTPCTTLCFEWLCKTYCVCAQFLRCRALWTTKYRCAPTEWACLLRVSFCNASIEILPFYHPVVYWILHFRCTSFILCGTNSCFILFIVFCCCGLVFFMLTVLAKFVLPRSI